MWIVRVTRAVWVRDTRMEREYVEGRRGIMDQEFKRGIDRQAEAAMNGSTEESVALQVPVGLGAVTGDVNTRRDIRLARLNIAYGVGQFAALGVPPGSLVLSDMSGADTLSKRGEAITLVVLSSFQYWKEWLSKEAFDMGVRPRRFAKSGEVLAAGGTIDWGPNNEKPTFSLAADMRLLIEKPAELMSTKFYVSLAGKEYAPAIWTVDKTMYKNVAPIVMQAAMTAKNQKDPLRQGLEAFRWQASANIVAKGPKTSTVVTMKSAGYNSNEFIEEIRSQLGAIKDAEVVVPDEKPANGASA